MKIASDASYRRTVVSELKELCERYSLDGVDFDWEAPTTQEETAAYIRLLHETHSVFHNTGLLVTVALHPGQTLGMNGFHAVDRVHLMTYDMSMNRRGNHAEFVEVKNAAEMLVVTGCPKEKIGEYFYGAMGS